MEDLEFGIANDIDYVALSFVRTGDDIRHLREFIISKIDKHKKLPIIAKIEKREALDNIDEIIREADAIMVARGDLGRRVCNGRRPHCAKDDLQESKRRR